MVGSPEDQDQQWLLNCLNATLDANRDVRTFAETSLQQASLQSGFGTALARIAANRDVHFGLRQLSAVLLKQFIKQHWQEDDDNFVHPIVSLAEKASIREILLFSLDDQHGKLRTAIAMAVASIAHHDWPEDWPELLPYLLKLISDQANVNGVGGALRTFDLLSDDLDDSMVPKLVPILFPQLYIIMSSPNVYGKPQRSKAISIFHSCISVLASMSGVYWTETRMLVMPMLKARIEYFANILQSPFDSTDPDDWSMKTEVLKCLMQLIQNFPDLMVKEFSVFYLPLWQTFISCLQVYLSFVVQGGEDTSVGIYDSDGKEKSLESFVIQLFEFLLTIIGSSRFAKIVRSSVRELVFYSVSFLQITEEQMQTWSVDPNRFVADESDVSYSCRVSGSLLLEEVINSYGIEGINFIIEAAQKHYDESTQRKNNSSESDWWRVREASIYALCSVSDQLLEEQGTKLIIHNLSNLLHRIFLEGLGPEACRFPFLQARIFASAAKFLSLMNKEIRQQFLLSAIQTISFDGSPAAKVGACQALSQLLSESDTGALQPHLLGLFSSLIDLLKQASEETLHLVLETLKSAVQAGKEHSAAIEPIISPIILHTWVENVSDPFISIDALEVLEAIKNAPGCMEPLATRVLPSICSILEKPQIQSTGLVAGSLDLLTMLLKDAPAYVLKAYFENCFNSVVNIIMQSDDHGEMQNATQCLASFVSAAKQELLTYGGDPAATMKSLLSAASRLLDPDVESSGSLFVGSYILQLILHFPSEMGVHVRDLVGAIIRRMQSCEISGLKSSLIVLIARLVHLCAPNLEQFINLLLTIPTNEHKNSLEYVMFEWTKQQPEIQGAYQIKITNMALALLLSTGHPELGKVNVHGHLIKSCEGIITRSRAKKVPERWTIVPLPSKIFGLLANYLVEIQEQDLDGDEDDDWDEDKDGDLLTSDELASLKCSAGHLNVMANALDDAWRQDGDYSFEDLVNIDDPLSQINMEDYLKEFFMKFSTQGGALFENLYRDLSEEQRTAVNRVVRC